MNTLCITRRDALAAAGMLVGGAVSVVWTDACAESASVAGQGVTVILQDGRYPLPRDAARRFGGGDVRVLELEGDPVRQWRGPQARLLAARDTRLLGVTSWPQFLMVRGLAEESGRRVRYQRVDGVSGHIVWLIA